MTRTRWLLVILLLAAVGVGVAVLVAPGDDSPSADPGKGERTTTTTSTGATTSTTAPPGSTTPTTAAPTTTVIPGACGNAATAIKTAVDAGVPDAATNAEVTECRLAASDTTWALVRLEPKAGSSFAETTVILQGGGAAWNVIATGGTNAGCGKAPQQVIADLGQFCVGSGGGGQ